MASDVDAEIARVLKSKHCFDLLGVPVRAEADDSAVTAAYRKLSRVVHPDKACDNPRATEAFQALQAAKEVLLDANKRAAHYKEAKAAPPPAPPAPAAAAPGGVAPSDAPSAWMFNTFDFFKEMKSKAEREAEKEQRRQEAEAVERARWKEIHAERDARAAAAREGRELFESKQRQFLDPMKRGDASATLPDAPPSPTKALGDDRLARTLQRLAAEASEAARQAGSDSGSSRGGKRKRRGVDGPAGAKRQKGVSDDAGSSNGSVASSSSSSTGGSRERKRRKKDKKNKKKKEKKEKKKKKKKSGKEDRFARLRAERLMREAGESLRQSDIWKED